MFKTITSVLDKKKNPSDAEIEKIPPYIFARWLSGNPYTIGAANQFNIYSKIPIVSQYKLIKTAFAGKIKYIPYPKNASIKAQKELEYVSTHFKINLQTAKEYISIMDKTELYEIVQMYNDLYLKHK